MLVSHDRAFLDQTVDRIVELESGTERVHHYVGGWTEYEAARERARAEHEKTFAEWSEERARFSKLHADRREQARVGGKQADRRGTHALMSKTRAAATPGRAARSRQGREALAAVGASARPRPAGAIGRPGRGSRGRRGRAQRLPPRPDRPRRRVGRASLDRRSERKRQDDAHRRPARPATSLGRQPPRRAVGRLRRDRAGPRPLRRAKSRSSTRSVARPACRREMPGRCWRSSISMPRTSFGRRGSLSPGERTRAELAVQAARGAGCLVLDEPTNHLDLPAVEELERALGAFDGALLLVTHDRRFLERVGVSRVVDLSSEAPARGRTRDRRRPRGRH